MTFDPKTHRFGMAYSDHRDDAAPFYPVSTELRGPSRLIRCLQKNEFLLCDIRVDDLKRAPEHDLILMQDALKLYDALEFYAEKTHTGWMTPNHVQYSTQPTAKGEYVEDGKEARDALTAWNEKYGSGACARNDGEKKC